MLGESAIEVLDDKAMVKLEQERKKNMPFTDFHPQAAVAVVALPFWKTWLRKFFK